ncbi:PREDICTED: uncharacterized protein LOC105560094 isoform X2 [Vollenhovia emeryi]|uniref:uncharacterized protein LOC105560094 isoform X2 n=1 Tax=Vollenhovia emeryi TaxID=411798 RepID=UPI0005F52F5E|nr:PREDICTED: uncharacterized protein LOC105560094 isoform X2 [Vollenhovia emeryi]
MNFFVILLIFHGISWTVSQLRIPDELKECYVNNNMHHFHLPMNMRVLLDIIRKAETYSYTTMDIRTMSSSLIHRFKLDGIKHYKDVQERDGILPFGQSGRQNIKYKLIKELVPGKSEFFPFDALTAIERCTLHQAISNTIMKEDSRGMNTLCEDIGQKLTGRILYANLWNCPREYGVILTSYGTIAPGAIIGAIAASLEHQNVGLDEIINAIKKSGLDESINNFEKPTTIASVTYIEDVDFIVPRNEIIHDRSMPHLYSLEPLKLDNVWLTTIAGDLAEMTVYQGPILYSDMELGATGFWNNTIRPGVYYLKNQNGYFDATRAEIVGDIDGLIIANKVHTWVNDFYSLRLSQILDMYYSDEGITLFNENMKVCDRKKAFSYVVSRTLLHEQVFFFIHFNTCAASHLLAYLNDIVFKSPGALKRLVDHAIAKFLVYANDHLLTELLCRNEKRYPQVEALISFDGSWTEEYTMDFVAALIDDLDVSMYGSKMGILHGASGQWLLNVTSSPSLAYYAISNLRNISWPTHLDFITTLNAISNYLNETWETKWQHHTIGSLGQVIVILAPLAQFSESDQQTILKLLKEMKHLHPELYFLYYVSEYNSHLFQPFLLSEQDHLILGPDIDAIAQYLSPLPRTLKPVTMSKLDTEPEFKDEIENYISPSKSVTYMLHSQYTADMKITITVHNFGYGTIKACFWNQFDGEEAMACRQFDAHKGISLLNNYQCIDTRCPHIYLRIQNATSFNKCAEMECRSPDQVRYIIRMQNTYNSAEKKISLNVFVTFYLYLQLVIFNI